jgi:hypothetical protein
MNATRVTAAHVRRSRSAWGLDEAAREQRAEIVAAPLVLRLEELDCNPPRLNRERDVICT